VDLHVVFDPAGLSVTELRTIESMGATRFWPRTPASGWVNSRWMRSPRLTEQANANAYLTLAPCAPQGCDFLPHAAAISRSLASAGTATAVQSGQPFRPRCCWPPPVQC